MAKNVSEIKISSDHSQEILKAMQEQAELGLLAIGLEAVGYAQKGCPVDTGRLRNSITSITNKHQSPANMNKSPNGPEDAKPGDYAPKGTPEQGTVYIGTNVEYAEHQEYRGRKKHFLKNAIADHSDKYAEIMKKALEE